MDERRDDPRVVCGRRGGVGSTRGGGLRGRGSSRRAGRVDEGDAPVVQAGALELGVLEGESKGSDEVQRDARRRARSRDGARVSRDLRRDEDHGEIAALVLVSHLDGAQGVARVVARGGGDVARARRARWRVARNLARHARAARRGKRACLCDSIAVRSAREGRAHRRHHETRSALGARGVGRTFLFARGSFKRRAPALRRADRRGAQRLPRARTPATDRRDEARLLRARRAGARVG